MRIISGEEAFSEWTYALSRSAGDVAIGNVWSVAMRWRVFMMVDDQAIAFPPDVAEALAKAYIERDGRNSPALSEIIDSLVKCAALAASKNAHHEVPNDVLAIMAPLGSA